MANLTMKVDSNVNRLRRDNGNFLAGIPDMEEEEAEDFADDIAENIKESIARKFERFDGDLQDGVDVKPAKSSGGGVSFVVNANAYSSDGVNYAAWHEFAKQNVENVPVKGVIKRWGADRGYLSDWNKYGVQTIEVTPINQEEGSFMQPAIQKAISKHRKNMRSGRNAVSEGLKRHFGG